MTVSVRFERLQNKARGDAVSHTGLDDFFRFQVSHQAPCCPHQSGVAIIPPLKAFRAGPNPFRFQFLDHLGPQGPELCGRATRPGHAERRMQALFPVAIGHILARSPGLLLPGRGVILGGHPELDGIF